MLPVLTYFLFSDFPGPFGRPRVRLLTGIVTACKLCFWTVCIVPVSRGHSGFANLPPEKFGGIANWFCGLRQLVITFQTTKRKVNTKYDTLSVQLLQIITGQKKPSFIPVDQKVSSAYSTVLKNQPVR